MAMLLSFAHDLSTGILPPCNLERTVNILLYSLCNAQRIRRLRDMYSATAGYYEYWTIIFDISLNLLGKDAAA